MTNEDPSVAFGTEVRRRREALGVMVEALAARSGLDAGLIRAIEGGERAPSLSAVLALTEALGVRPVDFFPPIDEFSPAALEIARLFRRAPREAQEAARKLLSNPPRPPRE